MGSPRRIALGALLVGATVVAYLPALHAGYVWDDDLHLLNNPVLKPGGLVRTWVPGTYINYWPLTFSTYWLENRLWGVGFPPGFHLVNILLHAGSALLVWGVLARVRKVGDRASDGIGWAAFLGAAIFALHPVNVESVAWVTQLKNVLSLCLTLLAVLLYLRSEDDGRDWQYVLSVGVFLLSTLAKGIAVTLPIVLLALSWWNRGRVTRRDLLRVLPFLVVGGLMAGVEVAMQKEGEPWEIPRTDGPLARLAGAGWCVAFYFSKFLWPVDLSFLYPRWTIDGGRLLSFVPDIVLLCLAAVAWWQRDRWGRGLFVAIVCYVMLLLPVLGFTNIYFMRYSFVADHWQYAAMIVPAATAGLLIARAVPRVLSRGVAAAAATTILVALGSLTYAQSRVFHDPETLWLSVESRNPEAWLAYYNLGNRLANEGRLREALSQYEIAARLRPDDFQVFNNLALARGRLGFEDEAIADFERALAIYPDFPAARANLAAFEKRRGLRLVGTFDADARASFRRSIELAPGDGTAHFELGSALANLGDVSGAVKEYEASIALTPNLFEAHDALARVLATRERADGGDPDRAVREARRACDLMVTPDALRLDTLGLAYASAGRFADAVQVAEQALARANATAQPDLAKAVRAHLNLFRAGKPYRAAVGPRER